MKIFDVALLIGMILITVIVGWVVFQIANNYLTYHYSNVVFYKGVNYTVNQTWVLPDSCSIQVYTTVNNTLVKDRNLTLNVYGEEFNSKEGVWWACCVMQCV